MTTASVPGSGNFLFPYAALPNGTPNTANVTLAANSGAKVAFVFLVPVTGTIDLVEFFTASSTGTHTDRVSFQDIDTATGLPDGGVDQFRTLNLANNGWNVPGLITSDGTNGGSKRSVTKGQLISIVFDYSAYTSGSATLRANSSANPLLGLAYTATHNGTSWSMGGTNNIPMFVLKYDTLGYVSNGHEPIYAATAAASTTYNSNSATDEIGVRLTLPFACTVDGGAALVDSDGDWDLVLYNSSNSAIASASIDKDTRVSNAGYYTRAYFNTSVSIVAGDTYRLTVKPTTTTSLTLYEYTYNANGHLVASAAGSSWYKTSRVDAGAFSNSDTSQPIMALSISEIDDGTGTSPPPPPPPPSNATRLVQGQPLAG